MRMEGKVCIITGAAQGIGLAISKKLAAEGASVVTENVYENRFMFADEIGRMGADIRIEGHHALVNGVRHLSGAPVVSPDLRGGAALVLAGLVAEGETRVTGLQHIDRGYEHFCEKLQSLGADIERRVHETSK